MTRRDGELEDKPEHFTRMLQGFSPGNEKYDFALTEHDNLAWGFNMKTIRSREWRMTYYAGRRFGELYDLSKDPHEFINLWDVEEYGEIKERLKTALLNRLISTEDCKQVREANY